MRLLPAKRYAYKMLVFARLMLITGIPQAAIVSLEERQRALVNDLSSANNENSDLHRQLESQRLNFQKDKEMLESMLSEVRSVEDRAREAQTTSQKEIALAAQRTAEAQEKYERELMAHAEDIKALNSIKEELSSTQASIRGYVTAAETAESKLTTSTTSWERQSNTMRQEISELNSR
jgi:nucleoprotein TPR